MAIEDNIDRADHFFAGTDVTLVFEIFAVDGVSMQDVSGYALAFALRKIITGVDPFKGQGALAFPEKTIGSGITVTGVFNSVRATNTQRVNVTIADTDTVSLKGGTYAHSLKRSDAGLEMVLSFGTVDVLIAPTR